MYDFGVVCAENRHDSRGEQYSESSEHDTVPRHDSRAEPECFTHSDIVFRPTIKSADRLESLSKTYKCRRDENNHAVHDGKCSNRGISKITGKLVQTYCGDASQSLTSKRRQTTCHNFIELSPGRSEILKPNFDSSPHSGHTQHDKETDHLRNRGCETGSGYAHVKR